MMGWGHEGTGNRFTAPARFAEYNPDVEPDAQRREDMRAMDEAGDLVTHAAAFLIGLALGAAAVGILWVLAR